MSFGAFAPTNLPNLPNTSTAIRYPNAGPHLPGVAQRLIVASTPCMAVVLRAPGGTGAAANLSAVYWTFDQSRLGLDCRGRRNNPAGIGQELLPGQQIVLAIGDANRVIIDMDNAGDAVLAEALRAT